MRSCTLPRLTIYTPKTILDVPLCHEDFVIVIGFGKGMIIWLRAWPN